MNENAAPGEPRQETPADALEPAVEEKFATVAASSDSPWWAVEEVRKLLESGEVPDEMLVCSGGLKSMGETGSLAGSLESVLGEDTVLVVTDRRIGWVNPKHRESGSGSLALSELRKVTLPRIYMFGKGQLTVHLKSGGQVPFGVSKKRKAQAKALAKAIAGRMSTEGPRS